MKKEAINPDNVWKPEDYFNIYHSPELPKTPPEKSGWEQAVRHGNWLFISGQTPTSPDGKTVAKDMHAQVRQALENTRNILKAVGGTTDDIMSIRYYFKAGYTITDFILVDQPLPQALYVLEKGNSEIRGHAG